MKKTSILALTMIVTAAIAILAVSAASASGITDTIGGRVTGGAAQVELVALLVDNTNTLQPIAVDVQQTAGDGEVLFRVSRDTGEQRAAAQGWRWRGWGLIALARECGPLQLRQGAKMLRGRCEAGIIVGDWAGAVNAPDMAMFAVAAASDSSTTSSPPAGGQAGGQGGNTGSSQQPVAPATAQVPIASPAAAGTVIIAPATVTPVGDIGAATPRPTNTPQPTYTPRPTDTPYPTRTPTPTPTPTATAVPIIEEQPATVVIAASSATPTIPEVATPTMPPSAAGAEVVATATPRPARPPAGKGNGGVSIVSVILWLVGLVILILILWLVQRYLRARAMDREAQAWPQASEMPTQVNEVQH